VTVPPTSTATPIGRSADEAWLPTVLATVGIGLLATIPALRRRRR
jgi:hypothetical protein